MIRFLILILLVLIIVQDVIGSSTTCSICLEEVENNMYRLPCNHEFHQECIRRWKDLHCPNCRQVSNPSTNESFDFLNKIGEYFQEKHVNTDQSVEQIKQILENNDDVNLIFEDVNVYQHQIQVLERLHQLCDRYYKLYESLTLARSDFGSDLQIGIIRDVWTIEKLHTITDQNNVTNNRHLDYERQKWNKVKKWLEKLIDYKTQQEKQKQERHRSRYSLLRCFKKPS